jgi:hypothetical protein
VFTPMMVPQRTRTLATSALPDAPVIAEPAEKRPGRARITISVLLRNTANVFADERQVLAAR